MAVVVVVMVVVVVVVFGDFSGGRRYRIDSRRRNVTYTPGLPQVHDQKRNDTTLRRPCQYMKNNPVERGFCFIDTKYKKKFFSSWFL